MNPFLHQIASVFYQEYGPKIARLAFVFPNRRAGLFFKKYLSELSEKPLFAPTILTINDLFQQLSGKQLADRIQMLFSLYTIYIEKSGQAETFDEFLYWGEMLLNDFDDVDKYMVDARMLFSNVADLRALEQKYDYLSQEQIAAIRTFWSSFNPISDSPNQKEFLAVWEILYELYEELKNKLAEGNKGYEGMLFREVVDRLKSDETCQLPYDKIIFVGLNALSVVEEELLNELQKRDKADFYWDYVSDKVADPQNRASYFVEKNSRKYPSFYSLPVEEKINTEIETIGIPSGVGQAKQVYSIVEELCRTGELNEDTALRTAIVLPDEHMLIPVLNSIPEQVKNINVTMGYPLAGTPIASLMEYVLALQKNIRYTDGLPTFYFRDVLPILNHRYVSATAPELIAMLVRDITENNKIYIGYEELDKNPLLHTLFSPVNTADEFAGYLIGVLEALSKIVGRNREQEGGEEVKQTVNDMEQEFIFHYFTTVNRMNEVMWEAGVDMQIDTYFRLVKKTTDSITIPFEGEPLSGLQIMGVLETRALDFDRLILLSVNEGVFPSRNAAGSFIPYNLRRGFGLPTYEHQDSVWAYHFYRLINRAKKVSLLYDTRSGGLQTGEVSRYVHQLRYHYQLPVKDKLIVYDISSSKSPVLEIKKSDAIMQKLSAFKQGGSRAISASALNMYLDCPLKFYFSVVEEVQEEEEVSETIESNVFGSILHKVMEELYRPFCGKMVTADLLKTISKDKQLLTDTINKSFAEEFFKSSKIRTLTGQNYLIGEMIRKYIKKILECDRKLTPFKYIESERKVNCVFPLSNGMAIQLKGFIDRIDEVADTVRIIDYKSGAGTAAFRSVESLFDKEQKDRSKAVMQVFLYAWMYSGQTKQTERKIQPGIYYMRTLFSAGFDAAVYNKIERKQVRVKDFSLFSEDFENGLRDCLDELFDPQVAFYQTLVGKACSYCPFKDICGKSR